MAMSEFMDIDISPEDGCAIASVIQIRLQRYMDIVNATVELFEERVTKQCAEKRDRMDQAKIARERAAKGGKWSKKGQSEEREV